METKVKVQVLSYTPDFEKNIARAGKLCYSPKGITELNDNLTDHTVANYLNMILDIGHGSVLEHSSITFGIEGISRSLSHQLVRHRIGCSYSQQSQRYVDSTDFNYIVPEEIKNTKNALDIFNIAMKQAQVAYNDIAAILITKYVDSGMDLKKAKKKAYEDARAVLPNATETKIVVTMNVRALFNFFKERLCERAQTEIREMALEMWKCCMEISPTIFSHAVPTCVYGKCKEGKMTCGKAKEVKQKFKELNVDYDEE